jgi:hypothetical protein
MSAVLQFFSAFACSDNRVIARLKMCSVFMYCDTRMIEEWLQEF